MGNDILLARVDLAPTLDVQHVRTRTNSTKSAPLIRASTFQMTDQWFTATVGSGEFHLQILFSPSRVSTIV